MITTIARVAGERTDYFNIVKGLYKAKGKDNGPSKEVAVKIDGIDFKWSWGRHLVAEHRTKLGRIYRVTISKGNDDNLTVDSNISNRDREQNSERDVSCHEDLINAVRHFVKRIDESSNVSEKIIAKKLTLSLGGVVIPMKPVVIADWRGDWCFKYNGPFKIEIYGEGNSVKLATLYARRADTTKRVSATLKGKILIKDLQKKLDEVIVANKLILSAPEASKTKGTVKIGDEVLEVNVTSLKLFQRHIVNLQKLYGKKARK